MDPMGGTKYVFKTAPNVKFNREFSNWNMTLVRNFKTYFSPPRAPEIFVKSILMMSKRGNLSYLYGLKKLGAVTKKFLFSVWSFSYDRVDFFFHFFSSHPSMFV